mmetsp:Transcript_26398/g.57857  ORF Transcript_26398/g.57857 Transcript_26398/m.57857 type:complete len:281 (+) Transcript_26398:241-1083(+)|eukprot:CAMPEP_0168178552 /NCGR_PEP_ID=MMETSP0139_2-20121125/9218_1 /TAXON_ID=44445 /ORGANISM="Pseudo-nitzschia australis, Strain 10249 10 AB" /LENGTH=280 /DNA_ID=CAMNT_0008098017 /DNA_START=294 /DNA_END=1136 /DNA_ORIENTATION=-
MTNRNDINTSGNHNVANTVRFSLAHIPEHRQDLCMGTKRSAWNSDEDSHHSSKHRDRLLALPPRRPKRMLHFLNELPRNLFVAEQTQTKTLTQCIPNREEKKEGKSKSSTIRKSILKCSKLWILENSNISIDTIQNIKPMLQPQSQLVQPCIMLPTRTARVINRPGSTTNSSSIVSSDDSSSGTFVRTTPTNSSMLIRNHRDSVYDLHKLDQSSISTATLSVSDEELSMTNMDLDIDDMDTNRSSPLSTLTLGEHGELFCPRFGRRAGTRNSPALLELMQ